jgi:hypothetical protein
MDGSDEGALNKFENGQWSAGLNDILTSAEKLLGRVETNAEKDAALAIKTFVTQFSTPLGAQALQVGTTILTDVATGQTVPQIAAAVTPQIGQDLLNDAAAAGQNTAEVVLNAARVALFGATASAAPTAVPTSSPASTEAPAASEADGA